MDSIDRFLILAVATLLGIGLLLGGLGVAVSAWRGRRQKRRREALAELARQRQGRFIDASHPALAQAFRAFTFFSHEAHETTARNHLVIRRGEIAVGCFDFDYRVRIEANRPRTASYRTSVVYAHSTRSRWPRGLVRRRRPLDLITRLFERWTEQSTGYAPFDRRFRVFSDDSLETLLGRREVADFLLQWNPPLSIENIFSRRNRLIMPDPVLPSRGKAFMRNFVCISRTRKRKRSHPRPLDRPLRRARNSVGVAQADADIPSCVDA